MFLERSSCFQTAANSCTPRVWFSVNEPRPLILPCLEPVAAVGYPPCDEKDRNGGGEGPPERKQEISQQTEQHEDRPEYFSLHWSDCRLSVLARACQSAAHQASGRTCRATLDRTAGGGCPHMDVLAKCGFSRALPSSSAL